MLGFLQPDLLAYFVLYVFFQRQFVQAKGHGKGHRLETGEEQKERIGRNVRFRKDDCNTNPEKPS